MKQLLLALIAAAVAVSSLVANLTAQKSLPPPTLHSQEHERSETKTPDVSLPPEVRGRGRGVPSSLVLLYTASANGQIRSCNCTKFRFGGYARELTLLKSIRGDCSDVILIEGGDTCGWTGFQAQLKAGITAEALKLLDYDAMIPGEEELGVRGARYIDCFDPKEVPIVCANLFEADKDTPTYLPYVILKTTSGLRIGVIALLDVSVEKMFISKSFTETVADPADILKPLVKEVRGKSDLVLVVFHATAAEAEKLADVGGVDLILSTHPTGKKVKFPAEDTNEVEAPVKTRNGVVLVDAGTKANWSLGRVDLELTSDTKIKTAKHTLSYLDRRYEEDPAMVKIYDEYNEKVKQAVLINSAKLQEDAEARLIKRGFNPEEMRKRLRNSPFATAQRCKDCHEKVYESWSESRHARAIADLEKTNQDYDPECITCHATGVLVRHGFENRKETPELVNVQCESCHGPGLAHAKVPSRDLPKAGEQICRSCHTDERTPDFNFETAWAKVKH